MLLSSESLLNLEIIKPNGLGECQQVGYDLTIKAISTITGGCIYKDKSHIRDYIPKESYEFNDKEVWLLSSGVYSLTFDQGVDLSPKLIAGETKQFTGFVRHRSSVLRCGSFITSGIFDTGFQCDNIGATLFVFNNIEIEKGSRIAQFYAMMNEPTNNLYGSVGGNSQYQGMNDLK